MFEFTLPSLGADMDKGTLLEWKVEPGQAVHKGDVVAVVDTSKAAVDVEIWSDGTVDGMLVELGQEVAVGTPILALHAPGETAQQTPSTGRKGTGRKAVAAQPRARDTSTQIGSAPAVAQQDVAPAPAAAAAMAGATRQRVSPAARQRAAQLGLDPAGLAGTGTQGSVTLQDVEAAAAKAGAAMAPAPGPGPGPAAVASAHPPLSAGQPGDKGAEMRRAIAAAMSRSKHEIPHYYLSQAIPMRKALDWLRVANAERPVTERLLPAALLLKAVALATREFPEMNGLYLDGVFHPSAVAHVGVAISLRRGGLIAPALHDVGGRELSTVMLELSDLVRRCRAGSLRSSEMSDPTITVTNLGDQGVQQVFGVIYPPQVALVGFGRVTDQPWVDDGKLVVMPVVTASLSADHRVSDGHRGALFLAHLGALLQQPAAL